MRLNFKGWNPAHKVNIENWCKFLNKVKKEGKISGEEWLFQKVCEAACDPLTLDYYTMDGPKFGPERQEMHILAFAFHAEAVARGATFANADKERVQAYLGRSILRTYIPDLGKDLINFADIKAHQLAVAPDRIVVALYEVFSNKAFQKVFGEQVLAYLDHRRKADLRDIEKKKEHLSKPISQRSFARDRELSGLFEKYRQESLMRYQEEMKCIHRNYALLLQLFPERPEYKRVSDIQRLPVSEKAYSLVKAS